MKNKECHCDNLEKKIITTDVVKFGKTYRLENVPASVCKDCGEEYMDLNYLREFEKSLKQQLVAA
jgi:YgiT-type zinc finger domain-containing protein